MDGLARSDSATRNLPGYVFQMERSRGARAGPRADLGLPH